MPSPAASGFLAWLHACLAEDPRDLAWPREWRLPDGRRTGLFDPHNAALTLYDVAPGEMATPDLRPALAAGDEAPTLCSRIVVFARPGGGDDWRAAGFGREGEVPGFWSDGATAVLRARTWGPRAGVANPEPPVPAAVAAAPLPPGFTTRIADPEDAAAIRDLLAGVFAGYPIPADPGVVRYAPAGGLVHGRVAVADTGEIAAYASAEFQPGGGAPEITDCATRPARRGLGLMRRLVDELRADLDRLFGLTGAYALVRDDGPAMARVLARAGWRRTGRLDGHYRVGDRWITAHLWLPQPGGRAAGDRAQIRPGRSD